MRNLMGLSRNVPGSKKITCSHVIVSEPTTGLLVMPTRSRAQLEGRGAGTWLLGVPYQEPSPLQSLASAAVPPGGCSPSFIHACTHSTSTHGRFTKGSIILHCDRDRNEYDRV